MSETVGIVAVPGIEGLSALLTAMVVLSMILADTGLKAKLLSGFVTLVSGLKTLVLGVAAGIGGTLAVVVLVATTAAVSCLATLVSGAAGGIVEVAVVGAEGVGDGVGLFANAGLSRSVRSIA